MAILYIKQKIGKGISSFSNTDLISTKQANADPYQVLFKKAKDKYAPKTTDNSYLFEQTKATHFGYVNKNNSMYPVDVATKSAQSWYTPFEKPVLKNHDLTVDPLGRHVHAAYIPFDIPSQHSDNIKIPKGVIVTHAIISDPDAMQKISDRRYLTVSIGATSTGQYCSICGQNWLDVDMYNEDRCSHRPGNIILTMAEKNIVIKRPDY